MLHKLYLALGWGPEYHVGTFPAYQATPEASAVRQLRPGNDPALVAFANRPVKYFELPRLMDKVAEHFGSSVPYVELENSGGVAVQGVVLEKRVYKGELMTAPVPGERRARSALSLALLEDTGWYFPDYDSAEPLAFGHKQGLCGGIKCEDFVLNSCAMWPSTAAHYVCPTTASSSGFIFDSNELGDVGCTFDRRGKGVCNFTDHGYPLPQAYRHFATWQSNLGGFDEEADFCPFTEPLAGGSCTDPETSDIAVVEYYEEIGSASRCFTLERPALAARSSCFRHVCTQSGDLLIKVGSEYVECPPEGGKVLAESLGFTVTCPAAIELCSIYAADVATSVSILTPKNTNDHGPDELLTFEVSNFNLTTDGTVVIKVGGSIFMTLDEDPTPRSLTKSLMLEGLPEGDYILEVLLYSKINEMLASAQVAMRVELELNQYAASIVAVSSEAAVRASDAALGAPDLLGVYKESAGAWAPEFGGSGQEVLTIGLDKPVFITSVSAYETFSIGSLTKVSFENSAGEEEVLWSDSRDVVQVNLNDQVAPRVAMTRLPSEIVSAVSLHFSVPSWVEVDAVKVVGLLGSPVSLSLVGSDRVVVSVRFGEKETLSIPIRKAGTSTLLWALTDPTLDGVEWATATASAGIVKEESIFNLEFTLDSNKASEGVQYINIGVRDQLGPLNLDLVGFELILNIDYSTRNILSPPLCYNGVITGANRTYAGACVCHPNAYGLACEYRECPKDCKDDNGVKRGSCNSRTGVCDCIPGYSGVDCSGQDGDCYISFDGKCRPGWEAGKYVINGADRNNLNYATGVVPRAMQCDDDAELGDRNTFGCSPFVAMELCCRAAHPPSCPFAPDAPVCAVENCTAQAWAPVDGTECMAAVKEHCFFNATDPACAAFGRQPPPPGYCPSHVAWQWCATHADTDECKMLVKERPQCFFADVDTSPCREAACQANVFSSECRPFIEMHCTAHPDDRECEIFSMGDRCRFLPGAAPCEARVCLEDLNSVPCIETIAFYCGSVRDPPDYECQLRGFLPRPESALPLTPTECPWTAIVNQCKATPDSISCTQLNLYGVLEEFVESAPKLPSAYDLTKPVEVEAAELLDLFAVAGVGLDLARSDETERGMLYQELFFLTDVAPRDGVLSPNEVADVVVLVEMRGKTSGELSHLNRVPISELAAALDAYAQAGFLTLEDLRAAGDSLIQADS